MAHTQRLMKVKGNGCFLQWPVPPFSDEQRRRGGEGYIVDAEHPLEKGYDTPDVNSKGVQQFDQFGRPMMKHVPGWLEGQMHKLEDAPEAKAPSPLELPAARRIMLEYAADHAPAPAPAPAPADSTKDPEKDPAKEPEKGSESTPPSKHPNAGKRNREPVEVIEGG